MKALSALKIGPRLGLGFTAIVVVAVAVVLVAITRLSNLTQSLTEIGTDRVPKVQMTADLTDNVNLIARELQNTLIWDDAHQVTASLEAVQHARDQIAKTLATLTPLINSDEGQKRLNAVMNARGVYLPAQTEFIQLMQSGKKADATKLLGDKMRPAQLAYMKAINELKDLQVQLIDQAAENGESSYAQAKVLMFGLLGGMVALSGLCGWLITRSITGPINEAVRIAETVAAGDLTSRIESSSRDETGQLLAALRKMNDSLVNIVGQVRNSSDSIAIGSSQIATGNADLSQRTEEQASNLQQTAASMEQLTATVKQNADTARQANQMASGASEAAADGGRVVGQVVETMGEITSASHKISDIISVIDGIAFQTNILALNAAVEAARAGEQGRGFAVVASEVRSLAQRSANAAKEIKTLIGSSVEKVETGAKLVNNAGQSINEIVSQVRRVNDLISEISSASIEQTQGISQIGDAVNQLDQVTQQNAALVEESAAAADSLSQQAANLATVVGVFKLAPGDGQPAGRLTTATRPMVAKKVAPSARTAAAPAPKAVEPKVVATASTTARDDWEQF